MTTKIHLISLSEQERVPFHGFSEEQARAVRAFHKTFPQYAPTPLRSLPAAAERLGLGAVYVKDESFRFGLNAFKVLGGSYAIGNILADRYGLALRYDAIMAHRPEQLTFITATDGNHGRGVAWAAREFGHKSVVYMPKGSVPVRLENIRRAGADASITDLSYDDAVRKAKADAERNGWLIVQDTAWPGYEAVPNLIMQGYLTMGLETWEQLLQMPTHIFLQAGVGSMAAAIAALFSQLPGESPRIVIVEPNEADCFFRTARANDGKLHCVSGAMKTIMAGLACGEPCPPAWEILKSTARYYLAGPDYAAETGMRLLGQPLGNDPRIISGESGASAFGFAVELMTDPSLGDLRQELGLNSDSRVLFFSTEGDTDPENYRKILETPHKL